MKGRFSCPVRGCHDATELGELVHVFGSAPHSKHVVGQVIHIFPLVVVWIQECLHTWTGWLKDHYDEARSAIRHAWEEEKANRAFVLSLGIWICHCVGSFGVWFACRLCRASQSFPILELSIRHGNVLILNLVSIGDFEFSLDLCSCGIPDRLSSERFVAHRWRGVGDGQRGRLFASSYIGLFTYYLFIV